MSVESWATLAMVAALGAEKLVNRCNLYPATGMKSFHCQASKCFQFDVERSNTPTQTPVKELSGAHPPPNLPTISNELAEFARRLSISLPTEETQSHPPSVEKMG